MAYKPQLLSVANGGTGSTSFTAYIPVTGGTTATGAFQSLGAIGSSGQSLKSAGAGALPSFASTTHYYTLNLFSGDTANATNNTYYVGVILNTGFNTTQSDVRSHVLIPYAGTIIACYGNVNPAGRVSSNENITQSLLLNNTTNTVLSSTAKFSSSNNTFSYTGLSIAVSAADYIQMKYILPNFATSPNNVRMVFSLLIQLP